MPNEECRAGPNQAVFFILHPAFFIQAAFLGGLPKPRRRVLNVEQPFPAAGPYAGCMSRHRT
jgi:hypothetical protein